MIRNLLRKWAFAPKWHPRTDATPKGVRLYASDGKEVWEIWGDGKPIGDYAVRVHFWAVKHWPDPPAPRRRGETVNTGGLNPPGGDPLRVRLSPPILEPEHFVCTVCQTPIYLYMQDHLDDYTHMKASRLCIDCDVAVQEQHGR